MTNWELQKLDDVIEKILGGGTPSKENNRFWNGSIPWASVKDLTNFNPERTQDYITKDGLNNSSSRLIEAGTLITPTRMALGFTVQFDVDVAINQDLKAIYPSEKINKSFLKYWFESNRKKIERLGVGSTVAGIQVQELKSLKINLPEKPEQRRIVAVLEIWDEYLELLDRKITLKEQLKKGLMQQLLTGKKRLPGFTDEWHSQPLKSLVDIRTGKKDVNQGNPNGEYPFFTCSRKHTYSDQYSFDGEAILIAGNGDVGHCKYFKGKFEAYQRTYVLTGFKEVSAKYIFPFMRHYFQNFINTQRQMGAMPFIKVGMLQDYNINVPADIEEQTAIAEVIQSADKEVDLLRLKLAKASLQKKYLLKNLISGTIRTPENLHIKGAN